MTPVVHLHLSRVCPRTGRLVTPAKEMGLRDLPLRVRSMQRAPHAVGASAVWMRHRAAWCPSGLSLQPRRSPLSTTLKSLSYLCSGPGSPAPPHHLGLQAQLNAGASVAQSPLGPGPGALGRSQHVPGWESLQPEVRAVGPSL